MRLGIGLPAAVPDTDMTLLGTWAAESERAGFDSVGVIDRLIYDNLDPLTALAAASAATTEIELMSTVVNVCWRNNPVLLAKQISSVTRLSGGRLTTGLGMGGWPADYDASGVPLKARGALFERCLAAMDEVWETTGDRPKVVLGGTVPASFTRAAIPVSDGWVAPLFGLPLLEQGTEAVRRAWSDAGRDGRPRIVTGRYFSLGPGADEIAEEYIQHYYGSEFLDVALADTLTDADGLREELHRLARTGCDDVLLFPCSGGLEQIALLADAVLDDPVLDDDRPAGTQPLAQDPTTTTEIEVSA